jgi:hypothetical protein
MIGADRFRMAAHAVEEFFKVDQQREPVRIEHRTRGPAT